MVTTKTDQKTADHGEVAEIIASSMRLAALGGVVPIPYVDLVAIGTVQVRMIRRLAAAYNLEVNSQNVKAVVTSLLGTLVPAAASTTIVGASFKLVPGPGTLIGSASMAGFAAASTYAIGKIFVRHFENGGTMLDFSAAAIKEDLQNEFNSRKNA